MNRKYRMMHGSDLEIASQLIEYLREKGVPFSDDCFPIFDKTWFLTEEPDEILPFYHRNVCSNKLKTCICFNSDDVFLYPRIAAIFDDLSTYKQYMAVAPMDISVSRYMLLETQRFNLLLNALFLAVLGRNGVKIVPPLRFGSVETIPLFRCYEEAPIWSIGCLGTGKREACEFERYDECGFSLLNLLLRKNKGFKVLVYGAMRKRDVWNWRRKGLDIRPYCDFQKRSRMGEFYNE